MSKKNLLLGGFLIILVSFSYLYMGPFKKWQEDKNKIHNFLEGIDLDQVNKIAINRRGKEVVLEKDGDKWKISGTKNFYAPDDVLSRAMEELKKAQKSEMKLVSTNKDRKDEFKVDETGVNLKLENGDDILKEIIIGKMSSDFKNNYVAQVDDDKIYSLEAALDPVFNREDWYDKTIFKSDKEKISKIRFQYPRKEFSIEKKDEKWSGVSPYKFKVSPEKIKDVLEIMSNLKAVKIPEQDFKNTGLEKNLIIIEAGGEGFNNVLMVGDAFKDDDQKEIEYYYAKKGDSDNIYLITKEQKESLEKNIWNLK